MRTEKTYLKLLFCLYGMLALFLPCGQSAANLPDSDECLQCHGKQNLKSRRGDSRFVDPVRFAGSVHGRHGLRCVSCHHGIGSVNPEKRVPHERGATPLCAECHAKIGQEYSKSLHARMSEKICYSCHNPHYSISFRRMSARERRGICIKCHDPTRGHLWLPQRELHFKYLECTACHALGAQIGVLLFLVDHSKVPYPSMVPYASLRSLTGASDENVAEILDRDKNGVLSAAELHSVITRLHEEGAPGVALDARILVLNPTHNFSDKAQRVSDCTLCHSRNAQFYSKFFFQVPEKDGSFRTYPVDRDILVRWGQKAFSEDLYLLGESKIRKQDIDELAGVAKRIGFKWLDILGVATVLFTALYVAVRGIVWFLRQRARGERSYRDRQRLLPLGIRAWHWIHGLCVILLVLSAVQLRLPDLAPIFASFLTAVNLHNLSAVVVMLDYAFWIVYHLWKRDFRRLIWSAPRGSDGPRANLPARGQQLDTAAADDRQAGRSNPDADPMEKLLYFVLMMVVLPIQIGTGVLLWRTHALAPVLTFAGGLRLVDGIHVLSGYVLVALLICHAYVHTLKTEGWARRAG